MLSTNASIFDFNRAKLLINFYIFRCYNRHKAQNYEQKNEIHTHGSCKTHGCFQTDLTQRKLLLEKTKWNEMKEKKEAKNTSSVGILFLFQCISTMRELEVDQKEMNI